MSTEPDERTPIKTVPIEHEPGYVGAHSSLVDETCQNWIGDHVEDVEACGDPATHTVVMWSGRLHQIAMCDACGEPEDVLPGTGEREWSGEYVEG